MNRDKNKAQIIEHYLEKSQNKDFDLGKVRKELESYNIQGEEIKEIIKYLDNAIQKGALKKSQKQKYKEIFLAGALITLLGLTITIGTYTGWINMGDSFNIEYGLFITGVSMMVGGYTNLKSDQKSTFLNRKNQDW